MAFLAVYFSKDGYHTARSEQENRVSTVIQINAEYIFKNYSFNHAVQRSVRLTPLMLYI